MLARTLAGPSASGCRGPPPAGLASSRRIRCCSSNSGGEKHVQLNIIPETKWEKGIPTVMGAHYMPSGQIAPISTSKGAGEDMEPFLFSYPGSDYSVDILQYANDKSVKKGFAKRVIAAATAAIAQKDSFTLVLSGGSLVNLLAVLASKEHEAQVDFSKWHVFWVDERNVPHSSSDSNYKAANDVFLSKTSIPASQIHAITEGLNADQAATAYEGMLLSLPTSVLPRNEDGFPIFDLVLLGLGPDGHVASLFPNTLQTAATEGWVLGVNNSPKPPPERITMTLPVINAAAEVAIVACGEGKKDIVQRVLETQSLPGALPAQLVRPASGKLSWIVDVAAGQDLEVEDWTDKKAYPRSTLEASTES